MDEPTTRYQVWYKRTAGGKKLYSSTPDYGIAKSHVQEIKDNKNWTKLWIVQEASKVIWEDTKE